MTGTVWQSVSDGNDLKMRKVEDAVLFSFQSIIWGWWGWGGVTEQFNSSKVEQEEGDGEEGGRGRQMEGVYMRERAKA